MQEKKKCDEFKQRMNHLYIIFNVIQVQRNCKVIQMIFSL